jgi:hypothetical protein
MCYIVKKFLGLYILPLFETMYSLRCFKELKLLGRKFKNLVDLSFLMPHCAPMDEGMLVFFHLERSNKKNYFRVEITTRL